MDPQIVATLTQTISVASATGADVYGQPSWGAPATRSVCVERSDKILAGANGEQLRTSHLIITTSAIGTMDRIWLPGDSSSTASLARRPMSVEPIPDELSGTTSHWEVYV